MPGVVEKEEQPLPFNLTDLDRAILSQTDEEYVPHNWEELRKIIAANDLHLFKRTPSELRKYIAWSTTIKAKYGSMVNYIAQERLHWGPTMSKDGSPLVNKTLVPKNPAPFADSADYKILRNDWPYGCEPGIHHLVVWMKTRVPVRPEDGSLIPESSALIDGFVKKTFVDPLTRDEKERGAASDRVAWFKNWTALQSVAALEHFHVLVRNVSNEMLIEWTGEVASRREATT